MRATSRRKIVRKDDGIDVWKFEGKEIPNIGLNAVAGRPPEEYGIEPTSFDEMRPGCYDIHERVQRHERATACSASMCFPSLPRVLRAAVRTPEPTRTARSPLVQAYNDWHIDEWCGTLPRPLHPVAILPIWDPRAVAAEVRRVAEKGCHAVTFSENPDEARLPEPPLRPLGPVLAGVLRRGRTIVCLHIGSSSQLIVTAPDAPIDVLITLQGSTSSRPRPTSCCRRVFKKFPDLQVALSEGGIGWIPYFLERLDHTYQMHHAWTGSDFGDRCRARCSRAHRLLLHRRPARPRRGARSGRPHLLESDYPHSDSTWPTAPEALIRDVEGTGLTDAEINKMTHENAMRFYQYDPFVHIRARRHRRCTAGRGPRCRPLAAFVGVAGRSGAGESRPSPT